MTEVETSYPLRRREGNGREPERERERERERECKRWGERIEKKKAWGSLRWVFVKKWLNNCIRPLNFLKIQSPILNPHIAHICAGSRTDLLVPKPRQILEPSFRFPKNRTHFFPILLLDSAT